MAKHRSLVNGGRGSSYVPKLKPTAKERRMAAQVETLDLTKEIADSGMYSYDRPAYTFWNGAAQALAAAGYENDTVIHILKSKVTRWMLDAGDEKVVKLGRAMMAEY